MNARGRKFAKKTRQRLKRLCPTIYQWFFAHLSDEEFIKDLSQKKALIESGRGGTLDAGIQFPDGSIEILPKAITVPREEGVN